MDDVKAGKVNCIVVKDLSRFGRDYIETGNYLEKIFPFLGVRFISITDHFDSFICRDAESALMIPLKNMVNDVYAKDISRKIITSFRHRWIFRKSVESDGKAWFSRSRKDRRKRQFCRKELSD